MPSKGAYIYETFGKQMDKSNIFEAKRPKPLEKLMSEDVNSTIFSCMKPVMDFSAPSDEKVSYTSFWHDLLKDNKIKYIMEMIVERF